MMIFTPYGLATMAVSATTSTASGALNLPSAPHAGTTVRIHNAASVVVFIKFGDSTVTAATTNMPIPAGGTEVFQIGPSVTHIAAITASGSGTLYATTGVGA